MQLDDKTVIITGASSGIGAAAALIFAAEGANVVLGARREARLDELVGQILQRRGKAISLEHFPIICDRNKCSISLFQSIFLSIKRFHLIGKSSS